MFKVTCPGCAAPYQVDERKVPETGLLMRCPKCLARFRVSKPGEPPPDTAPWRQRSSPLERSILISYRPADSAWAARAIRTHIERALGPDAVFDLVESDAPVGSGFALRVQESLRDAVLVLAIVGKKWTGRRDGTRRIDVPTDPIRRELGVALAANVATLIVRVDDAKVPHQLPSDLAALGDKPSVVVRADDRFRQDMEVVLDHVRGVLDAAGRGGEAGVSVHAPETRVVPTPGSFEVAPGDDGSIPPPEDVTEVSRLPRSELPSASTLGSSPPSRELFTAEELQAISEPPLPLPESLSSLPPPVSVSSDVQPAWVELSDPEDPAIANLVTELAETRAKLGDARPVHHDDLVESLGRGVKNARDMRRGLLVRIASAQSRASIQRRLA